MPPCAYLSLRSLHHACLTFHNFKGHQVRHVMIEGEPWFVAADVCRVIYGSADGMGNHYRKLADDQRRSVKRLHLGMSPGKDACLISESGLYKLIMRSDKPEAATFQDWVTREVLPAIRKTGGYLLNEEARETAAADQRDEMPIPQTYPDALRAFADALERRAQLGPIGAEMATVREREETAVFCGFQVAGRTAANYPALSVKETGARLRVRPRRDRPNGCAGKTSRTGWTWLDRKIFDGLLKFDRPLPHTRVLRFIYI